MQMSNPMNRQDLLSKATQAGTLWDIIVIGGGATGLGIAVESAGRGYRTLLLEKGDFGSGTSSHSTKLIHGGIRYLKDFSPKRLIESAKEQDILNSIAPHLINTVPFVLPSSSIYKQFLFRAGLIFFDILTWAKRERRSYSLETKEIKKLIPNFNTANSKGGTHYLDCQFDDARYALTLAKTAEQYGAIPLNYIKVTSLLKEDTKVCGVTAHDALTKQEYKFSARVVINACGPLVDLILGQEQKNASRLIVPLQGTHIVLDKKFLGDKTAFIIPETSDGRVLYAIPWKDRALIGTTETLLNAPSDKSAPLKEEVDYLLQEVSKYLDIKPTHSDILSAFSGIRPLVKPQAHAGSKRISRDHTIITSPSGLITITGGKWTTYRVMAEDTLKVAGEIGKLVYDSSFSSISMHLFGWKKEAPKDERLKLYGTAADKILEFEKQNPSSATPLHPNIPITKSMIHFAIHEEMAMTLEDVLSRRTRCLHLDAKATLEIAPKVVGYMGVEMGKDEKWCEEELERFSEVGMRCVVGRG